MGPLRTPVPAKGRRQCCATASTESRCCSGNHDGNGQYWLLETCQACSAGSQAHATEAAAGGAGAASGT